VARKVDFRQRHVLQGVSSILLTTVRCGGDEVAVRLEADPADRRNALGWKVGATAVAGASVGAVLAGITGLNGIVDGGIDVLLVAASSAGAGGVGGRRAARRSYEAQLGRLADDLEGTLDRLERGA
jgi:hypothetical protein